MTCNDKLKLIKFSHKSSESTFNFNVFIEFLKLHGIIILHTVYVWSSFVNSTILSFVFFMTISSIISFKLLSLLIVTSCPAKLLIIVINCVLFIPLSLSCCVQNSVKSSASLFLKHEFISQEIFYVVLHEQWFIRNDLINVFVINSKSILNKGLNVLNISYRNG